MKGLILLVCGSQSVRVLCIEGTVSINCKGGFHPSIGDSSLLCYKHHVRYGEESTACIWPSPLTPVLRKKTCTKLVDLGFSSLFWRHIFPNGKHKISQGFFIYALSG